MTTWIGIVSGLALTVGPLWYRLGSHLVIVAHEGGHALVALAYGGRVVEVQVYANGGGHTDMTYDLRSEVPITLAGYLAPSAIGFGTLAIVHSGRTTGGLAAMLLALSAILLLIRNLFGLVVVLALGVALFLILYYGSVPVQTASVSCVAWLLLLGSVRNTVSRFGKRCDDADDLAQSTGIPTVFWVTFFALVAVAAATYAGWLTVTGW